MGSRLARIFRPSAAKTVDRGPVEGAPKPPVVQSPPVDPTLHQPSSELLAKLKDVYVESTTDIVTQENPFASERQKNTSKLPQDRTAGYDDPFHLDRSTDGYLTVQKVLEVFDKVNTDKNEWSNEKIASHYKIDPKDIENLLKYYSSYRTLGSVKDKKHPKLEYHQLHE